ncbi:DsbA family protein [Antarcticirhabdus aurantiaca]|uniref:DsbA family protein n=1 Tax=Antarcticirhabdus aurantiaca TaxID=2606717 RepID=A0ACD4NVN7_9HYPH|nr:DsbA family protein [Antarcticirhabdus aurantiaca]WAJ31045.1 DsbA family protein [Jeongeuplla avenae]
MTTRRLLAAAAIGLLAAVAPAAAQSFDAAEKVEIEGVMRDYLLKNPEFLLEVLEALESKRAEQTVVAQAKAIESIGPSLYETPDGTVIGNPQGDVTVVEFFDYNCGYCKQALDDMDALVQGDPNLRFVLKEIPVLGPTSVEASHVSLAVREIAPAKYGEFHRTLLAERGGANAEVALSIAEDLGVDVAAVKARMESGEVMRVLAADNAMAESLQITGTPTYVIGNQVFSGALGAEKLSEAIANVRACGAATCG